MNIKEVSQKIFEANKKQGFWDDERNTGEMLMLVVSELSEALEAHRKNNFCTASTIAKELYTGFSDEDFKINFSAAVKDTFQDEIADAVIRLFDISAGLGISLEWHIAAKMRYNSLRPHKHGKSY